MRLEFVDEIFLEITTNSYIQLNRIRSIIIIAAAQYFLMSEYQIKLKLV